MECQDERSQYKNKDQRHENPALAACTRPSRRSRPPNRPPSAKARLAPATAPDKIRTYNFPQNRVTDHRLTGDAKNFNLDAVLGGNLDPLIDALTLADQTRRLQEGET